MSTRCNIVLYDGDSVIYLYRHHDGYLSDTGADLAEKVAACQNSPDLLLRSLLTDYYAKASYETSPRAIYELTDSLHGDIEYVYRVRFRRAGEVEIGYTARNNFEPMESGWARRGATGPLKDFVESVNGAIRQANARLEALKGGDNGEFWQKHAGQPELAVPA